MKELNFIYLLVVICSISTVLLAISFFCCNQRTGHRHNIVNINHQSIDSGFGKLPIFEFKSFTFYSLYFIFYFFQKKKYDEGRVNGLPKARKKNDFEILTSGIDNGLPKDDFKFSTGGIVNGLPEEESYEDFGNSSVPTIYKLLFVVSLYFVLFFA